MRFDPRRSVLALAVLLVGFARPADAQTISSPNDRIFHVGDPVTATGSITIVDDATPQVSAANDLRIRIPAGFPMTWDTSDTTATIGGGASGKVSSTVSYEDAGATLVLDVTTDFAASDTLVVSDLGFADFLSAAAADSLELEVSDDGQVTAVDDRFLRIDEYQADLAMTVAVDDSIPNVGSTITYTIEVANLGPDSATGVQVVDLLPAGLTYDSDSVTVGSYVDSTGLWTVGALAVDSTETLTLSAVVDTGTGGSTIANTASVAASDQADSSSTNDSDSASIVIQAADLALAKGVDDATPPKGATVTYRIVLTNGGPDDATGVEVTDLLPAGVTFVSATTTQGIYADSSGVWAVNSIPSGGSPDTLSITATVAAAAGSTVVNQAALSASDQEDGNGTNDTASASLTVSGADLAVTKTVDEALPSEGGTIVYEIAVANAGPDDATGVEVTDLLPAGTSFVSAAATQGTYADSSGVWTVGGILAAASDTLLITATLDAGTAGSTIQNLASLTASSPSDFNVANDADSVSVTVVGADLAVTKTVDDPNPAEGGTVIYEVAVANAGPDDATGVEVTDLLPAGVTFVSASATTGTYADSSGVWTVGGILAAASDTLLITATVDAGTAGSTIQNLASLTASTPSDFNPTNDADSVSVTVVGADLAITKTVDDPNPVEGGTVVYEVAVTNAGPDDATGVEVTDLLPAGTSFVSAAATQGTYADSSGVWTVGAVTAAASDTLLITATIDAGTAGSTIQNLATLTASSPSDFNATNDADSVSVTVAGADLSVAKTVDDPNPSEGGTIVYEIAVANAGPDDATGVEVTDLLPAGTSFVSAAATQGTYADSSGVWTVGGLIAAASDTLLITATLDAGTAGSTIQNLASLTASTPSDFNAANDADSVSVTVVGADLSVAKTVDDPNPSEGGTIVYEIAVANAGPDDATGVEVTDLLPAGVTFVSASATTGTYADSSGVWTVGGILTAASDTLLITATVDAGTAGSTIQNLASLTASSPSDFNVANDADSVSVTVVGADLSVAKTVDDPNPSEGGTIVYEVAVMNAGPDDATGVEVTDLLPAGTTFVSASATTGTYADSSGVWALGGLIAAASDTLLITATINAGTAGSTIQNLASLTASTPSDFNVANDADSVSVTVVGADLSVAKTVDDPNPAEGGTVVYEIAIANAGPDDATGVEVTDLLPAGTSFVSAAATQGTYADSSGVWTVGGILAAASDTLLITATIDAGTAGSTIQNLATLTASSPSDFNAANDADSVSVTVAGADLAVTKTVDDPNPNVGATVEFTVGIANLGPDAATGVHALDLLPPGLTYQSHSATSGTYDDVSGLWTVGAVALDSSVTLTLSATVDSTTGGSTIVNIASLTASDQDDGNPANDDASASVVIQAADLGISKSVDDVTPPQGGAVVYTVELTNAGPDAATGVEVTDQLPAGLAFQSAIATRGTYDDSTGIWVVGAIPAGGAADSLTLTATVLAAAGSTLVNFAAVTATDQADPAPSNEADSVAVTVSGIDLAVTKTVDDPLPSENGTVVYEIAVSNAGPDDATGVEVADALPVGVTFVSSTATAGSYDDVAGLWTVGGIPAATSDTLDITATIDPGTAGTSITNVASVSASFPVDTDGSNDADSVAVTVRGADLGVTKTVDVPGPVVGDTIKYAVVLTNDGPDDATNVQVDDALPTGTTFVSSAPTNGIYISGTGVWILSSLANGAADTLFLTATVDSGTVDSTIVNTASIALSDQADGNAANDSAFVAVTVRGSADLALGKSVDDANPDPTDPVEFTVVVSNLGPDPATAVAVVDSLPPGLTFVSGVATRGAYDDGAGLWTVGDVAPATADTLLLTATVDVGTGGSTLVNTASLGGSATFDGFPANDADSASVLVRQPVDLLVAKGVDEPNPNIGDLVVYSVTVENQGPGDATGIVVTDALPAGLTWQTDSVTQGTYDSGTGAWSVGALPLAAIDTLTITAEVDSGTAGDTIVNAAAVTALDQFDSLAANDADSASVVVQSIDISVTKTVSDPSPAEGDTLVYTLVAINLGPSTATNVQIEDILPAGVTLQSAVPGHGTWDPVDGIWYMAGFGAPALHNLKLTVTVDVGTTGSTIDNTARLLSADQVDRQPLNDVGEASFTVQVNPVTISSGSDRIFPVGSPSIASGSITIGDGSVPPVITAANDVRVRIPTLFPMTWDVADSIPTLAGSAAARVAATVAYEDSGRTLVLDVLTDFASGDTLIVSDLGFAGFAAPAAPEALGLEVGDDGQLIALDDRTVAIAGPTLAAAGSQTFVAGGSATPISPITIAEDPSLAALGAARDLRVRIPAGFPMAWDAADSTPTFGGSAATKVSPIVGFEDAGRTLVIDVTVDFAPGDSLVVSDLSYADFSAAADSGRLALEAWNDDAATAVCDRTLTIVAPSIASATWQNFVVGGDSTLVRTIAIVDHATVATIRADRDLRVRIPAGIEASWSEAETSVTIGGPSAAKVASAVTYEDSARTVVLDVTTDFAANDRITVDGLRLTGFSAPGGPDRLELEVGANGLVSAVDPRTIEILPATASRSSAIAVGADGTEVWVVNPDHGSVSVIDAGTNTRLAEIPVGREPWSLAVHPTNGEVWVALSRDDRVAVIDVATRAAVDSLDLGFGTFGVSFDPTGMTALVTAGGSDELFVVDVPTRAVLDSLSVARRPSGIAWEATADNAWITHRLTPGPTGTLTRFDRSAGSITEVALAPLVDPDRGGYLSGMQNPAMAPAPLDSLLWIPGSLLNTDAGALAGHPLTPTNILHATIRPVDVASGTDLAASTYFLSDGGTPSTGFTGGTPAGGPVAVDFRGGRAYVANLHSEAVTVVDDDLSTPLEIAVVPVGRAPIGVVTHPTLDRAWVANWLSRDVTVLDTAADSVLATVAATATEVLTPEVLLGKRLFYSSKGDLSLDGRVACAACHVGGGHDARTWDLGQFGKHRRSTPDPRGVFFTGAHDWTGDMDELADHNAKILDYAGGAGLISGGGNPPLGDPNAGLSSDLDALAAFLGDALPRPDTPFLAPGGGLTADADSGRSLFEDPVVGCATCHVPPLFTDSRLDLPFVKHLVGTRDSTDADAAAGFDTPSLIGVWDGAPYLHDGRAATLEEVLTTHNPADQHGTTSHLAPGQIDRLVAYLRSIAWPDSVETPVDAPVVAVEAWRDSFDRVYPNPFRRETSIRFTLERSPSQVRLEIFDVTGRRVRTVLDGPMTRGGHVVAWDSKNSDGRRVAAGVYWARLLVDGRDFGGKKMVVLR